MTFKLYDCDVGIKYNGANYDFEHVNTVTIEDPEFTRLSRGANANNKTGLVYKECLKEPKRITCTIMNMPIELKEALDTAYSNKDRLDFFCVSRADGSSKMGRNAILSQQPQQKTLDDSPDSMNVELVFETFDTTEVHKS
jgi:hypothetical protein